MAKETETSQRLLALLKELSFSREEVILSSGKKSDFYIDARRTSLHPEGINLAAEVLWQELSNLDIDAVGGPESGAIPLVAAVVALSYKKGKPLRGFFVRKETKAHGLRRRLEGSLKPKDRVAIVEDVATTGATTLSTVKAVEQEGYSIVKILALVDRQEGAAALLKEHGYQLDCIYSRQDLLKE